MTDDPVEWRPIPGWEGRYSVSADGRVVSFARRAPLMLALQTGSKGYLQVGLCAGNKCITRPVHSLVALAFLGPRPPDKPHIRHLDGDKVNNAVDNLAYGTASENVADCLAHGTHPSASKTKCVHGHDFTSENTRRNSAGARVCKTCKAHARAESERGKDELLSRRDESGRLKPLVKGTSYGHAPRIRTQVEDCGCDACDAFLERWRANPEAGSGVRTA